MSEIFAGQFTAVANAVLATFAIITAVLAGLAFRKQAREVSDQAAMLELQRQQLSDQQAASAKQAEVLELQAKELRKSLEERLHAAEEKRRAQAAQVTTWFAKQPHANGPFAEWGAMVRNNSDLPVLDVRAAFHRVDEPVKGLGWTPLSAGTSLASIRVLPPHAERHLPIAPDTAAQDPQCDADVYVASITFTDTAGNKWERDPRGALNPLS
jgi:hypothetical protein